MEDQSGRTSARTDTVKWYSYKGVKFDGTAEYLTLPTGWYNGDHTICLWFNPDSVATGQTLLSMSDGDKYYFLSFDNNEVDFFFESANDADVELHGNLTVTAGAWHQVCANVDHSGSQSRLFVNGTQRATSGTFTNGVAGGLSSVLTIGHEPAPSFQATNGNKTDNFAGVIDNLMIWDVRLSNNAISALYNGGIGFNPQFGFGDYQQHNDLQVYLLMGDDPADVISGGGAIINDTEGNYNATPVNFEQGDFGPGSW